MGRAATLATPLYPRLIHVHVSCRGKFLMVVKLDNIQKISNQYEELDTKDTYLIVYKSFNIYLHRFIIPYIQFQD